MQDMRAIHNLVVGAGLIHILEGPNPIFAGYVAEVHAYAEAEKGLGYIYIDQEAAINAMQPAAWPAGYTDYVHPGPAVYGVKAAMVASAVLGAAK